MGKESKFTGKEKFVTKAFEFREYLITPNFLLFEEHREDVHKNDIDLYFKSDFEKKELYINYGFVKRNYEIEKIKKFFDNVEIWQKSKKANDDCMMLLPNFKNEQTHRLFGTQFLGAQKTLGWNYCFNKHGHIDTVSFYDELKNTMVAKILLPKISKDIDLFELAGNRIYEIFKFKEVTISQAKKLNAVMKSQVVYDKLFSVWEEGFKLYQNLLQTKNININEIF